MYRNIFFCIFVCLFVIAFDSIFQTSKLIVSAKNVPANKDEQNNYFVSHGDDEDDEVLLRVKRSSGKRPTGGDYPEPLITDMGAVIGLIVGLLLAAVLIGVGICLIVFCCCKDD